MLQKPHGFYSIFLLVLTGYGRFRHWLLILTIFWVICWLLGILN